MQEEVNLLDQLETEFAQKSNLREQKKDLEDQVAALLGKFDKGSSSTSNTSLDLNSLDISAYISSNTSAPKKGLFD